MLSFERPAVRIRNLTKSWGGDLVLRDINLDICANKITTILGFSGAGKSTLMKHMLRLLVPDQGSVTVLGQDLGSMNRKQLRDFRRNFGMLFQYAALFDSMSAMDNVMFPMSEFTTLTPEERRRKACALLASVGLEGNSHDKLSSELSGGMRKRVGLARALALDPQIMLYDEPTTGLDPITCRRVNNLIVQTAQRNRQRGMTSIIISHDVRASLAISDFVAFLDHGKIIEYLPAKEFAASENETIQEFINL